MKQSIAILLCSLISLACHAEMKVWTLLSGKQVEGEYVAFQFDNVIVRNADGERLKIPFRDLVKEDQSYVELENPPKMSVDFLEAFDQRFPKPSPLWADASPVILKKYSFGARVKQKSLGDYQHDLTIEIYAISQQIYDRDKYHLLRKIESPLFRLSDENNRRYEFHDETQTDLIKFLLEGRFFRGEKFAESLVLVRDERGRIVAYNTTKNWLYNNLEKLQSLPVGAWFDDTCTRVHPTCPKDELTLWGEDNR